MKKYFFSFLLLSCSTSVKDKITNEYKKEKSDVLKIRHLTLEKGTGFFNNKNYQDYVDVFYKYEQNYNLIIEYPDSIIPEIDEMLYEENSVLSKKLQELKLKFTKK